MRVNNNSQTGVEWQKVESGATNSATVQVQKAEIAKPIAMGTDGRASRRQAEAGINAGLVADRLQKELKSLSSILQALLAPMGNSTRQQTGRSNGTGSKADVSRNFPPSKSSSSKQTSFGNADLSTSPAIGRRFTPGTKTTGFANADLSTSPAVGRRFTPDVTTVKLAAAPPTKVGGTGNVSNQAGPQSETDIAIDPTNPNHLIGGSNDISNGQMRVFESVDGGKTWTNKAMPAAPNPYNSFASDPAVTFDGQGNAYYSYLGIKASIFGASGTTLVVSKKPAGATSWGAPVVVPNVNADKNLMTADRTNSKFKGNVYVAWDNNNSDQTQSLMLGTSSDGGKTFTTTKVNNSGTTVIGADPTVGPNGEVYTAWANYSGNEHNLYINSSLDGGKTFGKTDNLIHHWNANTGNGLAVKIPADPQRGVPVFPFIDVDRSNGPNRGTMYAVYNDSEPNGKFLNIYLQSSKDGGKTWSNPVKVNDDTAPNHDHFFPRVAVDDTDGSVNIGWLDTRNDPANKKTDYYYARSIDGGKTFEKNVKVSAAMMDESGNNLRGIFGVERSKKEEEDGPIYEPGEPDYRADANGYGDYTGLAAYGGVVRPLWAGTTTNSQAEDVFSAAITNNGTTPTEPNPTPPGPPSPPPKPPSIFDILLEILKQIFGF